MSSTEVAGAVNLLASLGYVEPVVQGARFENGELITPVKFGDSEMAREAEAQVAAEVLAGVSIGYRITELTLTEHKDGDHPVYTATRWELLEVSLCPVPADPDAGVRSDSGQLHPCSTASGWGSLKP